MPRWDYTCLVCGYTVESSQLHPVCPKHEGKPIFMERQPAAPNFVLKGPGFHKNDYPSK